MESKWNQTTIEKVFGDIKEITSYLGLKSSQVFLGEVGIARDTKGADQYLRDVLHSAVQNEWSSCVYSFREKGWSGMDFELGSDWDNKHKRTSDNALMHEILTAMHSCEAKQARPCTAHEVYAGPAMQ